MKRIVITITILTLFFIGNTRSNRGLVENSNCGSDQTCSSWELYRDSALRHFYNAEHESALNDFSKALELNPNELSFYPYWIYSLCSFESGKRGLEPAKDLKIPFYSRKPYGSKSDVEKIFKIYFKNAEEIGFKKLKDNSKDDKSRFYLAMAYAAAANFEYKLSSAKLRSIKSRGYMKKAADHFKIILKDKNSSYYYRSMGYVGGLHYMFGKTNPVVRFFLGSVPKDKDLGLKMLDEAYKAESENTETAFFYFSALYVEKKYREAREILLKLIVKRPGNFDIREYLIFIDIQLGYYQEAQTIADIALKDLRTMNGQRYRYFEQEFLNAIEDLKKKGAIK